MPTPILQHPYALQLTGISAGFLLLYHHTIVKLIHDWSTDPNFSHGFLIPFVSAYMIWVKKNELLSIPRSSSLMGLVILGFGMAMHVAGNVGAELFVMRVSMVVSLMGLSLYLWGMEVTKTILVPLVYLGIMIPIPAILWNNIAFPLQLLAAKFSSEMVYLLGIPVLREGNILHLANTSLEVVDACSGLRSLTSLLALSGAFAYIVPLYAISKWILFFAAIPIAVVVNVVRLTVTAMMAMYIGPEAAQGFLHDMSGLLVFVLALALVYLVYIILLILENRLET